MTTKVRTFIDFVSEALAADDSVDGSMPRPVAPARSRGSSSAPRINRFKLRYRSCEDRANSLVWLSGTTNDDSFLPPRLPNGREMNFPWF
ncbi:MAG: hypothetical protein CBARDCOR_3783 [uncultured Caballeronia sp.]|nr:MAG: hypothetical protein CBARDCOR_3783 [uncultured Caballeronia sp.]